MVAFYLLSPSTQVLVRLDIVAVNDNIRPRSKLVSTLARPRVLDIVRLARLARDVAGPERDGRSGSTVPASGPRPRPPCTSSW